MFELEYFDIYINILWFVIKLYCDFIKLLKLYVIVDVFFGYWFNCDYVGLEVFYMCFELFIEFEIFFGLLIIIV